MEGLEPKWNKQMGLKAKIHFQEQANFQGKKQLLSIF